MDIQISSQISIFVVLIYFELLEDKPVLFINTKRIFDIRIFQACPQVLGRAPIGTSNLLPER